MSAYAFTRLSHTNRQKLIDGWIHEDRHTRWRRWYKYQVKKRKWWREKKEKKFTSSSIWSHFRSISVMWSCDPDDDESMLNREEVRRRATSGKQAFSQNSRSADKMRCMVVMHEKEKNARDKKKKMYYVRWDRFHSKISWLPHSCSFLLPMKNSRADSLK